MGERRLLKRKKKRTVSFDDLEALFPLEIGPSELKLTSINNEDKC